jgi:hypothetical protein
VTADDDACAIALNLARNLGWPVFPCGLETKAPTRPKSEGGNGFKDASTDPDEIERLWRHWPGALIGIATGAVSGLDVLDVDVKHAIALLWWDAAFPRIPPTRMYRTRSGGHHAYFQHAPGIGNTQGKLARGVDSRGDGGYVIYWHAAGFECLGHAPIAPWPDWLRDCLLWQPPKVEPPAYVTRAAHADKAISGISSLVAGAREGERNRMLFWAACRFAERIGAGQIRKGDAIALLTTAAKDAGLTAVEANRTIASAMRDT